MATLNPRDYDPTPPGDPDADLRARHERGKTVVAAIAPMLLAGRRPDPLTWMGLGGEQAMIDALLTVVLIDPNENIGSPLSYDAAYVENRQRMVEQRRVNYTYWPGLVASIDSPAGLALLAERATSNEIRSAATARSKRGQ